jgi:sugar phosphate isomerase/epimerase
MDLGISSYTYVWWAGVPGYPQSADPLTPYSLVDTACSLGASVVQIADNLPLERLSDSELCHFARYARDRHIAIEVGTCGIRHENLRRYLKIAAALQSSLLRTLIDTPDHRPSFAEAALLLREIAPEFAQANVTLAVENHDRFRSRELRQIIERAASQWVGVCLDTANSLGCGEGIDQVLETVADLVVNLHVKDFAVRRLTHNKGFLVEGAIAGHGLLDIPGIVSRLRQTGRNMNVILEQWPPPEADIGASVNKEQAWAREGFAYLRALIDNIYET